MSKAIEITEQNFKQEVLDSDVVVMIDFWASWCGPCRMVSPVIDEIAKDFGEKIKVGKVNFDEQPSLAEKFKIMSIPTIMIFSKGEAADKAVGVRDKAEYVSMIEKLI